MEHSDINKSSNHIGDSVKDLPDELKQVCLFKLINTFDTNLAKQLLSKWVNI